MSTENRWVGGLGAVFSLGFGVLLLCIAVGLLYKGFTGWSTFASGSLLKQIAAGVSLLLGAVCVGMPGIYIILSLWTREIPFGKQETLGVIMLLGVPCGIGYFLYQQVIGAFVVEEYPIYLSGGGEWRGVVIQAKIEDTDLLVGTIFFTCVVFWIGAYVGWRSANTPSTSK